MYKHKCITVHIVKIREKKKKLCDFMLDHKEQSNIKGIRWAEGGGLCLKFTDRCLEERDRQLQTW